MFGRGNRMSKRMEERNKIIFQVDFYLVHVVLGGWVAAGVELDGWDPSVSGLSITREEFMRQNKCFLNTGYRGLKK